MLIIKDHTIQPHCAGTTVFLVCFLCYSFLKMGHVTSWFKKKIKSFVLLDTWNLQLIMLRIRGHFVKFGATKSVITYVTWVDMYSTKEYVMIFQVKYTYSWLLKQRFLVLGFLAFKKTKQKNALCTIPAVSMLRQRTECLAWLISSNWSDGERLY